MKRRDLIRTVLGGLTIGGVAHKALAQAARAQAAGYPSKPIRIVVPFPPGGPADILARQLGKQLGEQLGQPGIVENRPGANTVIGAENVLASPADGYSLLVGSEAGLSLAPAFAPITGVEVSYKTSRDFFPVSLLGQYGSVLTIHPSVPVQTLHEFVEYARKNPGKLSYASFGIGSQPQMMMEILNQNENLRIIHVPYKGVSQALGDLVAGRVQVMISSPSGPIPFIRSGQLKALAYSGTKRSPELPEIPTFAEAGMPDFEARGWFGIVVHANTPPAIKSVLGETIWSIVNSKAFQQVSLSKGLELPTANPLEFQTFLADDVTKWKKMVELVKPRLI
jgi:tripartite-type tricarboxylate transporter receptor subunit TctC